MLYKNFFTGFPDKRGYLNPVDLEALIDKVNLPNFDFKYQLISYSVKKNVFRGFHYQKPPFEQTKILIIHQGSIRDIIFPINSPNKSSMLEFDLVAGDVIVIPSNYAHGFYTKTSNVLLQYLMDKKYSPDHYSGFNPMQYIESLKLSAEPIISSKDIKLPRMDR
tara:strand:- start:99 stop:590 length:492 start_codon:yes stop_codon:yes gene_type:complete